MPALTNPRHEAFCQHVSAGLSQVESYERAGYPRSRSNASGLARKPYIVARLIEIAEEKNAAEARRAEAQRVAEDAAVKSAAEKLGIDREYVMGRLKINAELALRGGKITGTDGVERTVDRHPTSANTAFKLLGQEIGMFREQADVDVAVTHALQIDVTKLTDTQLAALDEIIRASEEGSAFAHQHGHSSRTGKTTH